MRWMHLILLCVRVSTVGCNACERGWGRLAGLEFLGEGGDGDFGAAEEEPVGAGESAGEDGLHGGEGKLCLGGEMRERKGHETVRIGFDLAGEGGVLGVGLAAGALVIAAEGVSAFGDPAAAAAFGVAVCAFVDGRAGISHGAVS